MIQLTDNLTISTIRSGKGDCVHICFIGSSGQPHNIIVDSGPTSSAGEFRNLLTSIIRSGETLDALIITHYDDDHIGGILKACDPGFTEIYFNAYAEATETENLSATQNQRLFHSLDRSKIHSSVLAGDEIAIDGARIIVHAPKPEMLSRAMAKMEEANAQLASVSDWTCSLDDLMAKPYPSSDTSIANQSSIVFTFEYAGIRNLFCGDAWAENIPGGKYDLVKLPHHGSIRNISDALLSRIQADTFLICADGTYQTLGFVLSNYFKETTRALRCLNRAYQISGNFIILETLALTYYQHSIRDAFIEEGSDKIDPARIHTDAIEKARDALLRVFSAADEMWLKGTFGRAGLQIFKCFYFMHDNFRIYKHYHDVMKYFDFPDGETKRDIQLCYLDVAIRKEPVNIDDYDALTDHDKKFYELAILLEAPMRLFNVGLDIQAPISEKELLNVLTDGEKRLQELIETQTDDRLGFDGVHTSFANLYGNGIMRFQWHAISEVKRHCESIKNPTGIESFQIYIDELETYDFKAIENRYKAFFEKYDDIISFEEWCHFYIRHGEYLKTKELYDSVFDERKYLIEDQPEYFYRSYIDFTLAHQFDLTPALRCFVEHSDEFKDIFIYMSFEMDLKFATCTFNDPDQMLDDVKILLDEGLYTEADYNEKCLIINMLNCRPVQAEQYAGWAHGMHPLLSSKYERMLLVWKGAQVMPNTHWNSMQQWIASQMFDVYKKEKWLRNPKDILFESCTSENKAIVVDLWTLYFFVKVQAQEVMSHFKTIYITYDTVSMALQEINQVNDDDIRRVLIHLQREGNVKLLSPTLEQQLTVRNPSYNFMEVHSACLLAQELNCPAFVGEFRFEIPEQLRSKVIRPDNLKEVMDCVMDKKLLEAE